MRKKLSCFCGTVAAAVTIFASLFTSGLVLAVIKYPDINIRNIALGRVE
jgi:hypothetical protein